MLNQRVCCVRTKPTELDDRFLFYFLPFPLKTLNDVTYSTTVKHLSSLDLLKFRFYAPNVREQHAIADFLDRETARLDTLVGKNRELIEKLKDPRPHIRWDAARRLGRMGAAAKAALPHLAELADDQDGGVRRVVLEAMRAIEPGAGDQSRR